MNLKYEVGQEVAIEAPKTITEIKTSEIKSITVCKTGAKYLTSDGAFSEEQLDAFAKCAPQQEDKPTPKYKVGDKARIIKNTTSHHFPIGEIVRIIETGNTTGVDAEYLDGHDQWGVHFEDLEPYVEDKPKFKVGDKVKIASAHSSLKSRYIGSIYTIESINPNGNFHDGKTHYGIGNAYVWFEDELEPYTEPEQETPLIVTYKMLEKLGACSGGLAAFNEYFSSGKGEYEKVVSKCYDVDRDDDASWLEDYKNKIAEMQKELEQEPINIKLYCKENDPGSLTKGKVYEFDAFGHLKYDDCETANSYSSLEDFFSRYPWWKNCLVPLVKRPAKVGEWVYIKANATDIKKKYIGTICKVANSFSGGDIFAQAPDSNSPIALFNNEYLVLDGYKPEPEYLNMEVVCTETFVFSFTVGKVYKFINGKVADNDGDDRPLEISDRVKSCEEWNKRCDHFIAKFIPYKGKSDEQA